ncbi:MAG: hypothetical protein IKR35_06130, partial [Lachnospiraceae bacterium]|nr:hypothetical protein [Lachnospiraceae bacterium]
IVAENGESIADKATITITLVPGGNFTVTSSDTTFAITTKLSSYGVDVSKFKAKSNKWSGTLTSVYSTENYSWTIGNGTATYFKLDGTPVT